MDVDGLAVRVGHPEDLIASKEASGRPKDLDVLPRIRRDLIAAGRLAPGEHDIAPPEPETPAYLREAIGERPQSRRAAKLWDNAAARIDEYRNRWRITDPDRALGVKPASDGEAKDRRIIERTLRRTERAITRTAEPPGPSVDTGR